MTDVPSRKPPCKLIMICIKFLLIKNCKIIENRAANVTRDLIGSRIKALRQARGLSQDDVARLLGFKDRQTVSTIETGTRRVSAQELLLAVEKLGAPIEYFTDPFRLEGEARFSWRQSGVPRERLGEYETCASRWIGAYRTLMPLVGRKNAIGETIIGFDKAVAVRGRDRGRRAFRRRVRVGSGSVRASCRGNGGRIGHPGAHG